MTGALLLTDSAVSFFTEGSFSKWLAIISKYNTFRHVTDLKYPNNDHVIDQVAKHTPS